MSYQTTVMICYYPYFNQQACNLFKSTHLKYRKSCIYNLYGFLLTCEKHFHDHIISQRASFGPIKLLLSPPLFIQVPLPRQESERSCICLFRVSIQPLQQFFYQILELFRQCGIFLLDFGTVLTVWYFSIRFWNCSDSVVFFYQILELI